MEIILKEECVGVGFLRLVQDRDTWRAVVKTVMEVRFQRSQIIS